MRAAILVRLERDGPSTSRELAAKTTWKPDTISARLNELAHEGKIVPVGHRGVGPGRPCVIYDLPEVVA